VIDIFPGSGVKDDVAPAFNVGFAVDSKAARITLLLRLMPTRIGVSQRVVVNVGVAIERLRPQGVPVGRIVRPRHDAAGERKRANSGE
jgi:hypothetical protein